MKILKQHEEIVLDLLLNQHFPPELLTEIKNNGIEVRCETSGNGYFFTFKHPQIPIKRMVYDKPMLIGEYKNIKTSFIVFVENGEITLECHGLGDQEIPTEYRNEKINIKIS